MNLARQTASGWLLGVVLSGCGQAPQHVTPVAANEDVRPAATAQAVDDAEVAQGPVAAEPAVIDVPTPAVVADALDHAGPVLVGQRLSELQDGPPWKGAGLPDLLGTNCEQYEGGSLPAGISMMALGEQVSRFEIGPAQEDGPILPTGPYGVAVGMLLEQARARLPAGAVLSPHAYDPEGGRYLTWQDPGSDLAIRLEIFDGKVTLLYWGSSESVELIEGCA